MSINNSPIQFQVDRSRKGPLYLQLKDAILLEIRRGMLRSGDRLPATRELARQLRLNRGTVSSAYDELLEEGVLVSHVGRGTFVSEETHRVLPEFSEAPLNWVEHFTGLEPPPLQDFPPATEPVTPFHQNIPDPDLYPVAEFQQALNRVMADRGRELLGYSPAEGNPEFVAFLISYLERNRGIRVAPENLFVVNGSQQALDLLARAFVRSGDTVAVEDPSYAGALDSFRAHGARIVGIGIDDGGLRLDLAESVLARERPKFLYLMPTYQNPTGLSLDPERRAPLLELARRYRVPVVEDDFDGELHHDDQAHPALKAQDEAGHVIYLGTPSKMLFPGLRLGWIAAAEPVVRRLSRTKQLADISGSQVLQAAFQAFDESGALDRHKKSVRRTYRQRRDVLVAALERRLPSGCRVSHPRGGMTLMVTLPQGIRSEEVLEEAAGQGVLFTPGPWFSWSGGHDRMRICYGSVPTEAIEPGVKRLAEAVRRAAKAPEAKPNAEPVWPQV